MVGEEEADLEVDADADADSAEIQEKRKECDKYWALYYGIRRRSAGVFSVTTRYSRGAEQLFADLLRTRAL